MKPQNLSPNLPFMLSHPAHLLSFGFGSGLLKPMPGTWGSFFGLISFNFAALTLKKSQLILICVVSFILGIFLTNFTSRALQKSDPKNITLDEIVAIWLALCFAMPASPLNQASIFLLFRFFDIYKPQPINYVDKYLKNGFGIMLDDLIACMYTLIFWKVFLLPFL